MDLFIIGMGKILNFLFMIFMHNLCITFKLYLDYT